MKILYLTNAPIPEHRQTDAHFQELSLLQHAFGGEIISAFPLAKPSSLIPRFMYGLHNRSELKKAIESADIIHVFSSVLHPFGYLKHAKDKKVIFSTLTPIAQGDATQFVDDYVVYDEGSREKLIEVGISKAAVSPAYVDFAQDILKVPADPFTLLMASAPWEKAQFKSKGILLLLEVLKRFPDLHITFIWRDILYDEMCKLVEESPHINRIKLVNGHVEIKKYLASSHAVVLLANHAALVKSYPHSLMEGLLSGRPILTSDTIPIAKEIKARNFGQVLSVFDIDALEASIEKLILNYENHVEQVEKIPANRFSKKKFLSFYEKLYQHGLGD